MICYLDTSVILRILFNEKGKLSQWDAITYSVSSVLARVEALRTIDRERLRLRLGNAQVSKQIQQLNFVFSGIERVELQPLVVERAEQPFPTTVRTLDALHLATAQLWQQQDARHLLFATHDEQQGEAAIALGFEVIGLF